MRLIAILGVVMLGVAYGADEVKCSDCHKTDPEFSHPVGVVPSMTVPAHLPLDNGRVSCNTCHVDQGARGHMQKRGTAMLRVTDGLCVQCHDGAKTVRSRLHGSALSRAHLRWPEREVEPFDESTNCQGCHDGALAGGASHRSNHRIGVRVDRQRHLRSPTLVPDELRLFDGDRVGCGSCHNPFAERKGLLAMDNRGSRLCLGCHDM